MAQLVFQTAFIGDALLSIPLIKSLKDLYPDDSIEIVCRPLVADLYKRLGFVDEAHGIDKSKPGAWPDLGMRLNGKKYQNVFCPHESFSSAKFVNGLEAKKKIGYQNWWNFWVFNKRVTRPMQYPEALRQLYLLTPLHEEWKKRFEDLEKSQVLFNSETQTLYDAQSQPVPAWADMRLELQESEVESKLSEYDLPSSFVCMAPGSVWATKQWGEQKFRRLCEELVEQGFPVVVTGSPDEKQLCQNVIQDLPETYNLAGITDLYDMIHVLRKARYLVSNDSGTMHLAAAAGCPTVSVFGPTVLKLGYRPWQSQAKVVQTPAKCRPCGLHGHKNCPIGTHECMEKVPVVDVLNAGKSFTGF